MTKMALTRVSIYNIHTICSMMEDGRFAVPAFQRRFLWSKDNVKRFLESIYRGYPIGTIVVLEEQADRFKVLSSEASLIPGPKPLRQERLWYVIDGAQRLAALYNCFYSKKEAFKFLFDLETEDFMIPPKSHTGEGLSEKLIDLQSLYSPEKFMEFQRQIIRSDNADILLDKVNRLHDAFKSYEIPVQVLANVSLHDVVSIFEVINSTGLRLSKRDIERVWREKSS